MLVPSRNRTWLPSIGCIRLLSEGLTWILSCQFMPILVLF